MKKFIAFALSAVMALSLAACGAAEKKEENAVQPPNPFTEYASMEEAAAAAGFDMSVPDTVDGSTQRTIQVLGTAENPMIEVIYHCGEGEADAIHIRKAQGSEDISGDYTDYAEENTSTVGEIQVTMKGTDGQVSLATWPQNAYTYSIGVSGEGISGDAMAALVAAVD